MDYKPEDLDKAIERAAQVRAIREKKPESFPKTIFPAHSMGVGKAFAVYEADNPEQLWNVALLWAQLATFKVVPILESARFHELCQEMKE